MYRISHLRHSYATLDLHPAEQLLHCCLISALRLECGQHALQRDDAIAAFDEILDRTPVEPTVGPQADPLAAPVRRDEELLAAPAAGRRRQDPGGRQSTLAP